MFIEDEPAPGLGRVLPAPMPVEVLRGILRYNPETGGMVWLVDRAWSVKAGNIAGTITPKGYLVIKIKGRFYKGHRLAWYLATGTWPDPALEIDHINQIKGDNRLANLRLVTKSINQKNVAQRLTWKPKVRPDGPRKIGRGFERPAPMTMGELRAMLSYDRETGLLAWNACPPGGQGSVRVKPGGLARCRSPHGYIVVRVNKILYPAHRIIWLWKTGDWPPEQIDHINGIRDDNRWENLRLATSSQNNVNRRSTLPNTSGYRGVCRSRGKWVAQIGIDGRHVNLGTFDTPEAAHDAYRAAVLAHHGEFGRVT